MTQRRLPPEPGESAPPHPAVVRFCPRCGEDTDWTDWLDPGSGQVACTNVRDPEIRQAQVRPDDRCGFDARSELTEAEANRILALEPPNSYRSYTWT